jgi:hypothetical protein
MFISVLAITALAGFAASGIGLAAWMPAEGTAGEVATVQAVQAHAGTPGLHACLATLGASNWQPILENGLNLQTSRPLSESLAVQRLGLTAAPLSGAKPAGAHCTWTNSSGRWSLSRLTHAPFPVHTGAPGDAVRWLQQRLAAEGTYREPIDGVPGPHTRAALAEFRAQRGLPPTPNLDHGTMVMLSAHSMTTATEAIRTLK